MKIWARSKSTSDKRASVNRFVQERKDLLFRYAELGHEVVFAEREGGTFFLNRIKVRGKLESRVAFGRFEGGGARDRKGRGDLFPKSARCRHSH